MDERAIGVFDSGFGGVSVLREAIRALPGEDFIYFGDNANMPYGDKPPEAIRALSVAAAGRLCDMGVKALVVACNTATSAAISDIRAKFRVPVVSVEPAVRPACKTKEGAVLVLATKGTIAQPRYQALVSREDERGRVVSVACSGLADKVEWICEDPSRFETHGEAALAEHLSRFHGTNVGAIVLGCTHYVFLRKQLAAYAQTHFPNARIFDGNAGTARRLKSVLVENGICGGRDGAGGVEFASSGDVGALEGRFFGLMGVEY